VEADFGKCRDSMLWTGAPVRRIEGLPVRRGISRARSLRCCQRNRGPLLLWRWTAAVSLNYREARIVRAD